MGYFSDKLAKVVEHAGSAQAFADQSGLARSTISRFINGKMSPDAASLATIFKAVDDPDAAELLEAYLLDNIPNGYRGLIRIQIMGTRVQEEIALPELFNRVRGDSRAMLEEMGRLLLEDPSIYDAFDHLLELISPRWKDRNAQSRKVYQKGEE